MIIMNWLRSKTYSVERSTCINLCNTNRDVILENDVHLNGLLLVP